MILTHAKPSTIVSIMKDQSYRYLNRYKCERCSEEWEDQWDCMCNDRCPVCNAEIEPFESEDLGKAKAE